MIHIDSRLVQSGDIFFALPGENVDGRQYISQAIERGASKVYAEAEGLESFSWVDTDIPIIPIDNLAAQQGRLADEFYDHPSQKLSVIGVTGTNGKTSVTHFIAQCIPDAAVIGTTGYGRLSAIQPLSCTTPATPETHGYLKQLLDQGCRSVAMEVSSHGLMQHRVDAVEFDIAVFTNLSQDHLDYHGTMDDYAAAKRRLFEWLTLKTIISNIDDPVGQSMLDAGVAKQRLSVGIDRQADIQAIDIEEQSHGFACKVKTPWGMLAIRVPLIGRFNVYNVLSVIAVCGAMGHTSSYIEEVCAKLIAPPGRLETYHQPGRPTVIVDFAHTPDALEEALQTVAAHTKGRLWCVFGCGGNRDRGKRAQMGHIASRYADQIILTNDNPRHENPAQIIDDILDGIEHVDKASRIPDRREAIQHAIAAANVDDLILIAGKGHEDYQIIGEQKLPFSDGEVVRESLE